MAGKRSGVRGWWQECIDQEGSPEHANGEAVAEEGEKEGADCRVA
jgi:hypothetical protein